MLTLFRLFRTSDMHVKMNAEKSGLDSYECYKAGTTLKPYTPQNVFYTTAKANSSSFGNKKYLGRFPIYREETGF